ncbi:biopolymer transporter ExbD [candidate division KSB1 bacterium]|nr:biopolymer transporter ExbD [candidate division KSB1 bacterium]
MKFSTKSKVTSGINTASMPDIIFMLLIFFMVCTTFKESQGLKVILPDAKKIEKLPGKRGVAVIWADRAGNITIDDKFLNPGDIRNIIYAKIIDPISPLKVVSLRIDNQVSMERVTEIHEELRALGESAALNVNYSARTAAD